MLPVAVFRHAPQVGPGFFSEYLDQIGIPWVLIAVDDGEAIPASPEAYSGLCFMGGPMSVNDSLPWIEPELLLIQRAVSSGIPVIGHCLGGQLLSKALGGTVRRNPVKEIGWSIVRRTHTPESKRWLGEIEEFPVFQWHGETFSLPQGSVLLLENRHCTNQAFAVGPHLGMQCHVEMTEELIRSWIRDWSQEFDSETSLPTSVQLPEEQIRQLADNLVRMREMTCRLYAEWVRGLRSG